MRVSWLATEYIRKILLAAGCMQESWLSTVYAQESWLATECVLVSLLTAKYVRASWLATEYVRERVDWLLSAYRRFACGLSMHKKVDWLLSMYWLSLLAAKYVRAGWLATGYDRGSLLLQTLARAKYRFVICLRTMYGWNFGYGLHVLMNWLGAECRLCMSELIGHRLWIDNFLNDVLFIGYDYAK